MKGQKTRKSVLKLNKLGVKKAQTLKKIELFKDFARTKSEMENGCKLVQAQAQCSEV
jgi:hypothetical protein